MLRCLDFMPEGLGLVDHHIICLERQTSHLEHINQYLKFQISFMEYYMLGTIPHLEIEIPFMECHIPQLQHPVPFLGSLILYIECQLLCLGVQSPCLRQPTSVTETPRLMSGVPDSTFKPCSTLQNRDSTHRVPFQFCKFRVHAQGKRFLYDMPGSMPAGPRSILEIGILHMEHKSPYLQAQLPCLDIGITHMSYFMPGGAGFIAGEIFHVQKVRFHTQRAMFCV